MKNENDKAGDNVIYKLQLDGDNVFNIKQHLYIFVVLYFNYGLCYYTIYNI